MRWEWNWYKMDLGLVTDHRVHTLHDSMGFPFCRRSGTYVILVGSVLWPWLCIWYITGLIGPLEAQPLETLNLRPRNAAAQTKHIGLKALRLLGRRL